MFKVDLNIFLEQLNADGKTKLIRNNTFTSVDGKLTRPD